MRLIVALFQRNFSSIQGLACTLVTLDDMDMVFLCFLHPLGCKQIHDEQCMVYSVGTAWHIFFCHFFSRFFFQNLLFGLEASVQYMWRFVFQGHLGVNCRNCRE